MAKIFISYSRKDTEFAKRLTAELQKSELDFWIDWEGIPPTVDWWREIEKGIEEADVFLFIISPDSAKSKICGKEIDTAVKNGKRIIPIVTREIEWEDTPPQLGHLNYIFFSRDDDFDTAAKKLLTAIQTDYEWAATHRRLQVKALEWERNNKENSFLLRGKDLLDAETNLALNTSKEPHPTDLQRGYIFESRKSTDRQRRILTSISVIGVIALALLAVFGFYQASVANTNLVAAQTAQVDAKNKQILADNNAATAVANEQEAKKQANIALARQLASQAQFSTFARSSNQMVSDLLSIQSLKLLPNADAASFLINNNLSAHLISSHTEEGQATFVAFSPDSKYVASNNTIWEAATGKSVTRFSQDAGVWAIAFSPDGKYLVSGGQDLTAHVWEVTTGKEVARMTHDDNVNAVAFSPDGKYVISGSYDQTARVWEAATGKEIARMTHGGYITFAAFSPNGQFVISGSSDFIVHVWEATTGKEVAHQNNAGISAFSPDSKYVVTSGYYIVSSGLSGAFMWEVATGLEVAHPVADNDVIEAIAFSPDGKYVVSGSQNNGIVQVWEAATGKEIARMSHDGRVRSVTFSPDGKYVASGSYDGTTRVWNIATGKEVARMTDTGGIVESIAFSPDGKYVVSGSASGAFVWDVATQAGNTRVTHDREVHNVAFSPDGKYVVSGSWDGTARIWEVATGREIARITDRYGVVESVAFSPDGKYVVVGGAGGILVSDAATGKGIFSDTINDHRVWSVAFSPDGKYIASGSDDHTIRVWEAATGTKVAEMVHDYTPSYDNVYSISFSSDGKYVVSGSADKTARIWEAASGKEVIRMIHNEAVIFVAFSPDGKYVLTSDGIPHVWEASTGKEIAQTFHSNVWSAAFSPDGKYVVFGGGFPIIWEPATNKEVTRIPSDDNVNSVAFSSDGKYVVTGSDDNTARVWEVATGKEVARMTHDDNVNAVAFSPDGKYVISGSTDKTARAWMWQAEDLIANACAVMPRNLTSTEWTQYISDVLPYQAVCENLPLEAEVTSTPTATP